MGAGTAVLGLIGLAGLTEAMALRREGKAARNTPPSGQDVEVEGIRLHVRVLGETGPDLVLIHGSSGNLRDFTHELAPKLAERYRVFLVDRPGLGWSDDHPEGIEIEGQARLIQTAVARLGAQRPIVLGQSYGGAVALAWGVTLPDTLSALVLVSSPIYPWVWPLGAYYSVTSHPLGQRLAIPLITAFTPRRYVKRRIESVFTPQQAPAGYAEHFGPDLAIRRRGLRANARQRRLLLDQITALAPRYDAIRVPVELLHGTEDRIVDPTIHSATFAQNFPERAHLELLPGVGHMPHHVAQDAVIAAVDRARLRANVK